MAVKFDKPGPRYRYISHGFCTPDCHIRDFRLFSHVILGRMHPHVGKTFYRVKIPSNMHLEKYSCDEYSTTTDNRTIKELEYDILMVMWNGKIKTVPKGADLDILEKEQVVRWQKSLFENPDTAYHVSR